MTLLIRLLWNYLIIHVLKRDTPTYKLIFYIHNMFCRISFLKPCVNTLYLSCPTLHSINRSNVKPWWHRDTETLSAPLAICKWNLPAINGLLSQRATEQSFNFFYSFTPTVLNKQTFWFEVMTLSKGYVNGIYALMPSSHHSYYMSKPYGYYCA